MSAPSNTWSNDMTQIALQRFLRREDGAITALALFMFVALCCLMGLSLDVANAYKVRTELQIAADTASHAALYKRAFDTADDAKAKAAALAAANLALNNQSGDAVRISDVEFGSWDEDARTFVADPTSRSAVRVTATRTDARGNGVATYLLGFVGTEAWDVNVTSVAATYRPGCLREGFVADDVVDIQSNNGFYNGFCLHSNEYISVNQNNYFEAGTVVSMPNTDNLDLPASGFTKNLGLAEALRNAFYQVRIVNQIGGIITSLLAGQAEYRPDYVTNPTVISVSGRNLSVANFTQNRIHRLTCNQNRVSMGTGTYKNMVIIASCPVTIDNGAIFENVIFANTSVDAKSFSSSHMQIGKDDHCGTGGGSQFLTLGGFEVASDLKMFGGQIIAKGDVQFAANADGIEGASIVSGSTISGTSNMTMGLCGNGMEDNFELDYYRIVG
jgi:Flp pilus assembly protein TadG